MCLLESESVFIALVFTNKKLVHNIEHLTESNNIEILKHSKIQYILFLESHTATMLATVLVENGLIYSDCGIA